MQSSVGGLFPNSNNRSNVSSSVLVTARFLQPSFDQNSNFLIRILNFLIRIIRSSNFFEKRDKYDNIPAADDDGDGLVFEMGSSNWNDAAIADDVRHGRTVPFSARGIEKGLVNRVGRPSLVRVGLT